MHNKFIEDMVECDNIDDKNYEKNHGELRVPLISDENVSEVWISVYSYKAYSNIRAEISLRQTPCRGLLVKPDICTMPGPCKDETLDFSLRITLSDMKNYTTLRIRPFPW